MTEIDFSTELMRAGAFAQGRRARLRFLARRYPLGAAGAVIMALFVFAAIFADFLTVYDPLSTNPAISLAPPSTSHWLGVDPFGRDVYSRIIYGARISLAVGIGATLLGSGLGTMIGLASGYLGGWIDLALQRIMDILQALPLLVLALVMAAALGPSLQNTIAAIAIPLIPYVARVIRSNTLALRELPFVEAAKAVGMSELRIAVRHVLPNTLAPLIVLRLQPVNRHHNIQVLEPSPLRWNRAKRARHDLRVHASCVQLGQQHLQLAIPHQWVPSHQRHVQRLLGVHDRQNLFHKLVSFEVGKLA